MAKIGYQGVYGAYSSMASLAYFGEKNEFRGFDGFPPIVDALDDTSIDFGVFPVENSTTGQIYKTLDLLKYKDDFFAIGETIVDVHHNLISFADTDISKLRYVYSHPEALSQCLKFFKEHPHISPVSYEDTAKSVSYIKNLGDRQNGALASSLAAKTNEMKILIPSVQDMEENKTRFLIFKKVEKKLEEIDNISDYEKMTCYFETKHKAGELSKILNIFSKSNYNLLSLHSRATKKNSFEYGFFVDVSCKDIPVSELKNTLNKLKSELTYFNLLGLYKVAN